MEDKYMDKLEYKGYYGSIEYSKEDNCLFGKVIGIPKNLISYEGETAAELYEDFKEVIDYYLNSCDSKGIKPHKSYSGTLNLRMPPEIHCRIAMIAEKKGTSINSFIINSIENQLQEVW
ncbi:antitoxin HicB [Bacteroidia bacterium]|nr:antitoxin HicB [Bacteroidia bacterium]GHT28662.1 antitoxin HicB [Bacteroidia bacterium]GHU69453.1 antitoxin HicB [Bacteroidia bacterium]